MEDPRLFVYCVIVAVWVAFVLLVQVRPKVLQYNDILVISSGLRAQIWCLGFAGRRIVVDPHERTIQFTYRRFWFLTSSRRIEFDWVEKILFGGNFLWCLDNPRRPFSDANTLLDVYIVQLRLRDGEIVTIYRYAGQDLGEGDPLMLVDLLSATIGVPVDAPMD